MENINLEQAFESFKNMKVSPQKMEPVIYLGKLTFELYKSKGCTKMHNSQYRFCFEDGTYGELVNLFKPEIFDQCLTENE